MIHGYWLILNENSENEFKIRLLAFEREDWGGPLHLGLFVRVGLINGFLLFLKEDYENHQKSRNCHLIL